jgi:hypothetical protein
MPFHQAITFHIIAAVTPARITCRVINSSWTVLDTVLATANSPMIYFATIHAKKFQNAAHRTALKGVKTFVITTVAIELAAS